MEEFDGKSVLITGASGNLGRSVSEAFYRKGARIALVDLHVEKLEERWSSVDRAFPLAADLMNPESVDSMVARILDRFGRIDILANIAGGFTMGPRVDETAIETWKFMFDLNASTVFHTSRAVIPVMRAQASGKVINIAARAALKGTAGMAPYVVSKSAVIRLTESLSEENKNLGINVNCVLPSIINTPENRRDMPGAEFNAWVSPDALADVIMFLASDAARAIHGVALPVSGLS
jgi:NAD(P)-dependent dehydrogenase (short-subunit alcohol dehydrogenase family)